MRCQFRVERQRQGYFIIRDIGQTCMSVTNDAEAVVEYLVAEGQLGPNQRLLYYDSEGQLDEIVVEGGKFAGFKILPPCFKLED